MKYINRHSVLNTLMIEQNFMIKNVDYHTHGNYLTIKANKAHHGTTTKVSSLSIRKTLILINLG